MAYYLLSTDKNYLNTRFHHIHDNKSPAVKISQLFNLFCSQSL